jgi:hypothetical protein
MKDLTYFDHLGIESVCIISNFAQALESILAPKAIRGSGERIVGERVEDLVDEVDDGVGAGTELTHDLKIHGRRLAVAGRDTGDVDKLEGLAANEETGTNDVALAEGILGE